jgi:hypothetical protein
MSALRKAWFRTVDFFRYIFGAETRNQAWIDGANFGDEEWQEFVADKDAFIEEQGNFIRALDEWIWAKGYGPELPPLLEQRLRDYR